MKLSTALHALAEGLTTVGLGITTSALLASDPTAAWIGTALSIVGRGIEASAHIIAKEGNGA